MMKKIIFLNLKLSIILICLNLFKCNAQVSDLERSLSMYSTEIGQYYFGTLLTTTNEVYKGSFRISSGTFFARQKNYSEVVPIKLKYINKVILKGSSLDINYRKDSIELFNLNSYIDNTTGFNFKGFLYRKIIDGEICAFDDLILLDSNYYLIGNQPAIVVWKKGLGYKTITEISQLGSYMSDKPYFMKSARITNHFNESNYALILYLINLYNDPNLINKKEWEKIEVKMINGDILKGWGVIQAFDYEGGRNSKLHFYDSEKFQLIDAQDIQEIVSARNHYHSIKYNNNFNVLAFIWNNNGTNYYIFRDTKLRSIHDYFLTEKSFHFRECIFYIKDESGKYVRAKKQNTLREEYLKYFTEMNLN